MPEVVELVENTGRVEAKAGTRAALDGLAVVEEPQDMSRLARLATAKGSKTRAILKLLGPAVYLLATSALDLAMWLLWAAFAVLGFCASCKAAVERMTQRHILRKNCIVRAKLSCEFWRCQVVQRTRADGDGEEQPL